MRKHLSGIVSAAAAIICIMHASAARADVTSWLSASGGYSMQHDSLRNATNSAAAMSLAVGMGTSPRKAVVVGGLFRTTTYFGLGTDLNLSARVATQGFARGEWGAAVDVGPTLRLWNRGDSGRLPIHGMLILGAPWGLELAVGGDVWSFTGEPFARGFVAVIGVDLLRLTVMRQGSTTHYWENPAPAGGRPPPPVTNEPPVKNEPEPDTSEPAPLTPRF
ncbi:MAG: hypothetical protein FWD69_16885 [Polyangiaceae bacterium]|nr:hypothetical protein [Polyangiaceae bacterium]